MKNKSHDLQRKGGGQFMEYLLEKSNSHAQNTSWYSKGMELLGCHAPTKAWEEGIDQAPLRRLRHSGSARSLNFPHYHQVVKTIKNWWLFDLKDGWYKGQHHWHVHEAPWTCQVCLLQRATRTRVLLVLDSASWRRMHWSRGSVEHVLNHMFDHMFDHMTGHMFDHMTDHMT